MAGYVENPDANAAAFVGGWFRTGDQGTLGPDGSLTITGRLKEIINRGGEKVAPTEVEDVLLTHPDVSDVAVFAVPHPTLGEDVGAVVVLRGDALVTAGALRQFVAEHLAPFKVPRRFVFADAVPKGPTGKVLKSDIEVAKNYLNEAHIKELNRIVSAYLDLAENRAERQIAMKMADWVRFLHSFLELSNYPILEDKGTVSALEAKLKAEAEFEVFRRRQDAEHISDFDREVKRIQGEGRPTPKP